MISEEVNPFGIPKLFIFGTVASGLVFGVVVGLTLIICKHKKVYFWTPQVSAEGPSRGKEFGLTRNDVVLCWSGTEYQSDS